MRLNTPERTDVSKPPESVESSTKKETSSGLPHLEGNISEEEANKTMSEKVCPKIQDSCCPNEEDILEEGTVKTKQYRLEHGVGPVSPESGNTVAYIKGRDGKEYYGTNSNFTPETKAESMPRRLDYLERVSYSPPKEHEPRHLGEVQSLTHAESDAIMQYADDCKKEGIAPAKEVILYVDRKTCNMCRGEIPSLLKEVGISRVTVYSTDMSCPLVIEAKK